ncbi:acyl-CoA thioesterase [Aureliella helgolandensis]|uniref:Acyl-CoA thioester hydrolase YbgC n=1 Tax=Aureliella helgolandensis TaxID=2527968 RepID=A0A518G602_9BACT|nr:thioesterase family protein [Aureliella helgolandensis]QDV24026.1 Acyl-CoA thioester hydrolase YbgC [Aureliella helgolandensis]
MLSEHSTELRVRYDECDPMGLVHHSNYLRYMEIARTELFRASGGNYRDLEASGLFVVVVRIECNYRQPAKYDDLLTIHVQIDRVTEAKIEQSYRVERDGLSLLTAKITLAVINSAGRPQRIPDSLR